MSESISPGPINAWMLDDPLSREVAPMLGVREAAMMRGVNKAWMRRTEGRREKALADLTRRIDAHISYLAQRAATGTIPDKREHILTLLSIASMLGIEPWASYPYDRNRMAETMARNPEHVSDLSETISADAVTKKIVSTLAKVIRDVRDWRYGRAYISLVNLVKATGISLPLLARILALLPPDVEAALLEHEEREYTLALQAMLEDVYDEEDSPGRTYLLLVALNDIAEALLQEEGNIPPSRVEAMLESFEEDHGEVSSSAIEDAMEEYPREINIALVLRDLRASDEVLTLSKALDVMPSFLPEDIAL